MTNTEEHVQLARELGFEPDAASGNLIRFEGERSAEVEFWDNEIIVRVLSWPPHVSGDITEPTEVWDERLAVEVGAADLRSVLELAVELL